jgi:DNA-binding LacI/PurR family transcriptional regulator
VSDHNRTGAVTLHDVAREAGVSYATASRALNGSDRSVRAENLARVQEAAGRLGYSPHLSAQAIARGSSNTVALIVGAVDDPYFASVADGVAEGAYQAGLTLTAAVTDRSPDMGLQIVRTMRGRRPRVILIAGSRVDDDGVYAALAEELATYRRAGGRVALLSRNDLDFPTLTVDHHGGAFRLAQALAGLGYRRFAVLHGDDRIRMSHDRRQGFLDGLRQAGIVPDPRHVIATDLNRDGGHRAAAALLSEADSRPAESLRGPGAPNEDLPGADLATRDRLGTAGPATGGISTAGLNTGAITRAGISTGEISSAGLNTGGISTGGIGTGGIGTGGIGTGGIGSGGQRQLSTTGLGAGGPGVGGPGTRIEVIFAVNDVMAIGAMTAVREAGLVPGRDIAVAGFDDIDAASDVTPTLTSVRVPLRDLGRRALELALTDDAPGIVEIQVEVVLRESTPPR